ncbi:helix-turn-helix domain-containing protein [Paenibacillus sp. P26]|nr:helix-turn-helix domain-containing protein [Paenibacillus sp. P26]
MFKSPVLPGEGSLITRRDIVRADRPDAGELMFDEDHLMLQMKTGRWEEAGRVIDQFFHKVSCMQTGVPTAKSYVIQLYMSMIRLGHPDAIPGYMDKLAALMEMETLQALQAFFKDIARQITMGYYEQTKKKHCAIVEKMLRVIGEHLENPELSLNWVAGQMLYMNSDYLGKLFKKETKEKFSGYVMKERIRKATELLERRPDMKIFELAERVGFGDNPQYFSQVFKKYTGCSPVGVCEI